MDYVIIVIVGCVFFNKVASMVLSCYIVQFVFLIYILYIRVNEI